MTEQALMPLDTLYNDFFYHSLLTAIFRGSSLRAPYDLATRLHFPALRTMAQQGLASVQKRDGKVLLCLSQKASPQSLLGFQVLGRGTKIDIGLEGFKESPHDAVCTYSKELPPSAAPYELVGATTEWKPKLTESKNSARDREPDVSKSTLHVFTVGVDKYTDAYSPLHFPVADADAIETRVSLSSRRWPLSA